MRNVQEETGQHPNPQVVQRGVGFMMYDEMGSSFGEGSLVDEVTQVPEAGLEAGLRHEASLKERTGRTWDVMER